MLTKFRKSADNIFIKILLGLVALSFIGFGGMQFLGGGNKGDVVTFSDTDSISQEEFLRAKSNQIRTIAEQNGINLTEEQIAELNIDHAVLRQLINDSMIAYLADYYDLDVSDAKVIELVKKSPIFHNKDGEFDLKLFKSVFGNSKQKEDEYFAGVKKNIIMAGIYDIFMASYNPPKVLISNMINYMAESRVIDLVYVKLNNKPQGYKAPIPDDKELQKFYDDNKDSFTIPELRQFEYIKASKKFLQKKLQMTEKELKSYYEDNKAEFIGRNYAKAKKEVRAALFSAKMEVLMAELSRNFENDSASGLSLKEMADKYGLKVNAVKSISLNAMNTSSSNDIVELAETVFEMDEGDISYPIEVQDKNEILLVELKSVTSARERSYKEVESKIKSLWQERALMVFNAQKLEEIQRKYPLKQSDKDKLKAKGIYVQGNKAFVRHNLPSEDKLSPDLLKAIFQSDKNKTTNIVLMGNKAYFAYVKAIKTDKNKIKQIAKSTSEHINSTIKEGLMQELIGHLSEKNKMKVNLQ